MHSSQRSNHVWALVLAGGDGTRLRSLTTKSDGTAVPKQYCSLHGTQTLLETALQRAGTVTSPRKICTVVAEQHRTWWQPSLVDYAPEQIIEQPLNRGTAIGIMLPLLHILERDPDAHVVMLPSDHYVQEENILTESLQFAITRLQQQTTDRMIILGMEPEQPDCELGYVLPGHHLDDGVYTVTSFVEKPPMLRAHYLLAQGALWNSFIVATKARTLVNLFMQRCAGVLEEMQHTLQAARPGLLRSRLLQELYGRLPSLDFSRDILTGVESFLEVLTVPACGWSDLGTPRRIREVLHRWPEPQVLSAPTSTGVPHAGRACGISDQQIQARAESQSRNLVKLARLLNWIAY